MSVFSKLRKTIIASLNLIRHQSEFYWQYLSWQSYFKFIFAIFLIFSTTGYLHDIMSSGRCSTLQLVVHVMVSGLVAVLWVVSFTHDMRVLPLAILSFFVNIFLQDMWIPTDPAHDLQTRLTIDSIGILLALILGFIFLIQFILSEGVQHIRLRTEIKLAKDLHDVLVPPIRFENASYEIYAKANPTDEIGGDLVDVCVNEDDLTCYIADVSGHGVAAGALMGMFKTAMNASLQNDATIVEAFNQSNKVLHPQKKRSMFITCACIRFSLNNTVEYSVAGHLPILHLRARENKIVHLSCKQIPITAKPDYDYHSKQARLESGDLFVLLTDGLTEVTNSEEQEFGIAGIEELLLSYHHLSLNDLFTTVMNEAAKFGQQIDDQTMLLIKCL